MKAIVLSALLVCIAAPQASAQSPEELAATACKTTGLIALQQRSKEVTDLIIDMDGLAVTSANTKVEDVPIKTVVLGEAYIKRDSQTGKPDRFVCLIGDKGKVLLTFFTAK